MYMFFIIIIILFKDYCATLFVFIKLKLFPIPKFFSKPLFKWSLLYALHLWAYLLSGLAMLLTFVSG